MFACILARRVLVLFAQKCWLYLLTLGKQNYALVYVFVRPKATLTILFGRRAPTRGFCTLSKGKK